MTIRHRLTRLEDAIGTGPCSSLHPTVILRYRTGESKPPTPENAPHCPRCGVPHVLLVEEVLVETRLQAKAALAFGEGDSKTRQGTAARPAPRSTS